MPRSTDRGMAQPALRLWISSWPLLTHYPARLLFDSRATTYAGLSQLTQRRVGFITIRRRGAGILARVEQLHADSWQHCQITQAKGKRRRVQYVSGSSSRITKALCGNWSWRD